MFNVGQQQFLVLLFVVQAECDELSQRVVVCVLVHDRQHPFVYCFAVGHHLRQGRAADQAPLRARMSVSDAVVVTVKENAKAGVKRFEVFFVLFKDEGFKKPAQVRQMPLGRAGVWHRLQLTVFSTQWPGQCLGLFAYLLKVQCKWFLSKGCRVER